MGVGLYTLSGPRDRKPGQSFRVRIEVQLTNNQVRAGPPVVVVEPHLGAASDGDVQTVLAKDRAIYRTFLVELLAPGFDVAPSGPTTLTLRNLSAEHEWLVSANNDTNGTQLIQVHVKTTSGVLVASLTLELELKKALSQRVEAWIKSWQGIVTGLVGIAGALAAAWKWIVPKVRPPAAAQPPNVF